MAPRRTPSANAADNTSNTASKRGRGASASAEPTLQAGAPQATAKVTKKALAKRTARSRTGSAVPEASDLPLAQSAEAPQQGSSPSKAIHRTI
ncbi:uncharacterized protein BDZ99DRAFT_457712 [Mytilinidion resinicola]|uniref:Uncharacterized protein n=1 Tax=Mytilinidion resinicola TaxID=574789 RepID=A0A6A6Z508_9PEZI|nr:uncharacterized protein BDZ99DRAFT_457712 [Mytilinidion resinicola]KAF2815743.1 hypothetical protein BDZ99DRAFT_457712 [Mytilinidion resinicola]